MIPEPTTQMKPRLAGPMLAVSLTVFLDLVGFGMILPLLPFYAATFGASPFQIGLLFASYSLAQFALSPIWGNLSDRLGRRRPLLVSLVVSCFAYLLFASAETLAIVFVARVLAGAAAANYTIAQAFVADVTTTESRATAMGWLGAAFGLGFVVGPALGGGLSHLGETAVPLGAAVLAVGNLVLVWRYVPESRRRQAEASAPISLSQLGAYLRRSRRLPGLLVLYGVVIFAFSVMEATLAMFAERQLGFGVRKVSLLFVFVGLLMVAVQAGLIRKLVPRFGESRLLVAGLASMAAGMLLLSRVESVGSLIAPAALLAIGPALYNPSAFSLISRLAPSVAQGSILGVARSLGALARVGGPIWGGWVFYRFGITTPFLTAGALLTLSLIAAIWMRYRYESPAGPVAGVGGTA